MVGLKETTFSLDLTKRNREQIYPYTLAPTHYYSYFPLLLYSYEEFIVSRNRDGGHGKSCTHHDYLERCLIQYSPRTQLMHSHLLPRQSEINSTVYRPSFHHHHHHPHHLLFLMIATYLSVPSSSSSSSSPSSWS